MSRFLPISLLLAAFALAPPILHAQQSGPAVPIPAPLLSAQKVFLANGGADAVSSDIFTKAGQVNEPYASLYNALTGWKHWQLLPSPEDADLILIVRFNAIPASGGATLSYSPEEDLTILDGKSHVLLWSLTQPVQGAFRKATWEKNYADGVATLIAQLKSLTSAPAQAP